MITAQNFIEEFSFNANAGTSMYAQLAEYIRHQIKSGRFQPHDQMITENELCEILKISRTTVRSSMNELIEDGLIVRYRGRGSFVAEDKIRRKLDSMYNFTDSMVEQGIEPSSRVISATVIKADAGTKEKLSLDDNEMQVFQIIRLRCGNGAPLLLETTRIPYWMCKGIERTDFSNASLYNALKLRYGLDFYHAVESLEAIVINKEIAALLECDKKNMPGYKIERCSNLRSGQVFEYTTSVTRADKCSFKIDLYNQPGSKSAVGFVRQIKV